MAQTFVPLEPEGSAAAVPFCHTHTVRCIGMDWGYTRVAAECVPTGIQRNFRVSSHWYKIGVAPTFGTD